MDKQISDIGQLVEFHWILEKEGGEITTENKKISMLLTVPFGRGVFSSLLSQSSDSLEYSTSIPGRAIEDSRFLGGKNRKDIMYT